jgi:hypothetical protein
LENLASKDREKQFEQTISRLDANIAAQKVTIEQTKPRAYLTLRSVELTTSGNVDSISVHISNLGSSPGDKVSLYIHPFYAVHTSVIQRLHGLDDLFEQSWSKIHGGSRDFDHESTFRNYVTVSPGEDIHFSYFLSEPKEPLVDPEFPLSKNIEMRLYFRFEYSDPAGNWVESVCLQNTFTPSKGQNEDADWDGQRRGFKACIDSELPAGPQRIRTLKKWYLKTEGEY